MRRGNLKFLIIALLAPAAFSLATSGTAVAQSNLPQAATPAFSVAPGAYDAAQTVTLTDSTRSATIYFTITGGVFTTPSTVYSAPITVSSTETINAIAVAQGYLRSANATATYVIDPPAATPTFSIGSGTYLTSQLVSLGNL